MTIEIKVPTLGESVTEATVAKWFKAVGDAVVADEPLVELETDKVTLEVPAAASGTLGAIDAAEGDTVEVGALLGSISEGAGAAKVVPAKAAPAEAAPSPPPQAQAPIMLTCGSLARATAARLGHSRQRSNTR